MNARRRAAGLADMLAVGFLSLTACEPPCTPDLHPAVRATVPDADCAAIVVLLSQEGRPSLRCALLQQRDACQAWCGRSDLQGAARVRAQSTQGQVIAEVAVALEHTQCPTQPGVELDLASRPRR